jgi:hypothetical protein
MDRDAALDRAAGIVDRVERSVADADASPTPLPVPVREVWVYGDVALGLDPIDRLDVYITKDLLMGGDADREAEFEARYDVSGVGKSVDADWAAAFPEHIRANDAGHAAPERCLAAHLLEDDDPVHLEVCNASFSDNVTQRLKGAMARENYGQILDPRGVCLWADGRRDDDAMAKLRGGELAFPTLSEALSMLGLDESTADEAATVIRTRRAEETGRTVRGDVV